MDSCFCQYSLEDPNNQKTIYYNSAPHQMPYSMLIAPELEIIKPEAGVLYLENVGLLSHYRFCNILAAASDYP
jgi:hypothetical protein